MEQSPRAKEKIHESLGTGVIWVTSDPAVLPALIQHPEAWTQQQNENRADMWTPLWVGPGTKRSPRTITGWSQHCAIYILSTPHRWLLQAPPLAPQHPPAVLAPPSLGCVRARSPRHRHSPPRATACPWRSPHAPRWAGGRHHRWAPPSCHGMAGSTAPPWAPGRQRSAPSCPREEPVSTTSEGRAGGWCGWHPERRHLNRPPQQPRNCLLPLEVAQWSASSSRLHIHVNINITQRRPVRRTPTRALVSADAIL